MSQRRLPRIAIGAAAVALALAVTASIVAHRRAGDAAIAERRVPMSEAAKLAQAAVAADGVRVSDKALAGKLGLAPGDRIVALSGRRLASAADLTAALAALAALGPTTWFVELSRDGKLRLERWELDGAAPAPVSADDALLATIQRTGKADYAMPRATLEAGLADPARLAAGLRGVRAVANGIAIGDVRPGSIAAALGLQSGDIVRAIDGNEVTLDTIAVAIAHTRAMITLDLMRGDRGVILRYAIQ